MIVVAFVWIVAAVDDVSNLSVFIITLIIHLSHIYFITNMLLSALLNPILYFNSLCPFCRFFCAVSIYLFINFFIYIFCFYVQCTLKELRFLLQMWFIIFMHYLHIEYSFNIVLWICFCIHWEIVFGCSYNLCHIIFIITVFWRCANKKTR